MLMGFKRSNFRLTAGGKADFDSGKRRKGGWEGRHWRKAGILGRGRGQRKAKCCGRGRVESPISTAEFLIAFVFSNSAAARPEVEALPSDGRKTANVA